MSSSNNQSSSSAESCVANGLTLDVEGDIMIDNKIKINKSGGKSANILYKPTKKGLYVNMEVPLLTWGATIFRDPQSGKESVDLALQFPRKDYSTPDTDILLAKFQALEAKIKSEAVKNSMVWFGRKMTPEQVDGAWTPMLKYAKDKETGYPDMTKSPTLKVKLPCYDGKFGCEIYDPAGNMLFPDEENNTSPIDLIPKGVNIRTIIQCGGLWFANKAFGVTWRLFQAIVTPKPSMKGRCLIAFAPAPAQAKQQQQQQQQSDETSLDIADDDSDFEVDVTPPPPTRAAPMVRSSSTVPVQQVAVPVAVAPIQVPVTIVEEETVTAVEEETEAVEVAAVVVSKQVSVPAAAVVVKKKVVRKKD